MLIVLGYQEMLSVQPGSGFWMDFGSVLDDSLGYLGQILRDFSMGDVL